MAFDAPTGITPEVKGRRVKIGVLIGNGGRLNAIWEGTQQLTSLAELAIVISFKKNSPGIEFARELKIPAYTVRWPQYKAAGKTRSDFDMDVATMLKGRGVDLVVIAGWGLLLTREFLDHFPQRIINVHPALLTDTLEPKVRTITGSYVPVFRGNNALEMAVASGVDTTGCTVHYVTEEVDTGPIILKREVVIRPGDTLESVTDRVHEAEDDILPQAIELACEKILGVRG